MVILAYPVLSVVFDQFGSNFQEIIPLILNMLAKYKVSWMFSDRGRSFFKYALEASAEAASFYVNLQQNSVRLVSKIKSIVLS